MTLAPMQINSYPKRAGSRFEVQAVIDGYEVVASDTGRPVEHADHRGAAEDVCAQLNRAAKGGVRALSHALGVTDEDDFVKARLTA